MSQISTVMNSNIIPFVVVAMPCEITIFPQIFQIRFTVWISSYSINSMSVSVTRCDSPTESEKFLLEISFMYPENYNDSLEVLPLRRSSNLHLVRLYITKVSNKETCKAQRLGRGNSILIEHAHRRQIIARWNSQLTVFDQKAARVENFTPAIPPF